jgi:hypothetical protein
MGRISVHVAGGALSNSAVLVIGAANLAADGLSMAVGNFLAIRAHEGGRAAANLPEEEAYPWKHAVAMWSCVCRCRHAAAGSLSVLGSW